MHGVEKGILPAYIQKRLCSTGERCFGQILGAGRGSYRHLHLAPDSLEERTIGVADRGSELFRQRGLQYLRTSLVAFNRKLLKGLRIEIREDFLESRAQSLFLEQPPVRFRRQSKAIQNADALRL